MTLTLNSRFSEMQQASTMQNAVNHLIYVLYAVGYMQKLNSHKYNKQNRYLGEHGFKSLIYEYIFFIYIHLIMHLIPLTPVIHTVPVIHTSL